MFSFTGFLKKSAGCGGSSRNRSSSVDEDTDNGDVLQDASAQKTGKIKSIYRRPSSSHGKTKQVDGKCSIAEMKRIQFTQRMMWVSESGGDSRSPTENKDDDDDEELVSPSIPWSPPDHRRPRAVSDSVLPGSILKKPEVQRSRPRPQSEADVGDGCNSNSSSSSSRQKKQTNFKEEVDVYYYDHKDTPTAAATTTDSQKLKDHGLLYALNMIYDEISGCPYSGRAMMGEAYPRESEQRPRSMFSQATESSESHSRSSSSKKATKDRDVASKASAEAPEEASMFLEKDFELMESPDESVEILRLVIHLTDAVRKLRTSVKAMSGGYSLLVTCSPRDKDSKSSEDSPEAEERTERITLPLRVNPYSVKAFIHKSGKLIIESAVAWDGLLLPRPARLLRKNHLLAVAVYRDRWELGLESDGAGLSSLLVGSIDLGGGVSSFSG